MVTRAEPTASEWTEQFDVRYQAPDSALWARWPWQRCRGVFARWNMARRCDLVKNHGGVHVSEQEKHDDMRERVRRRMTEEGIPVGSDVAEVQALGAPPLHLLAPARPQYMRVLMDHVPAGGASSAVNNGEAAGDCLRACVASLLELDAEQVPHFVQYIEHPEGTDSHLWYWALIGFCDAHGWRVNWTDEQPGGWALADGKSVRGHQHVVIVFDGETVHDPHPAGEGLVETTGWFTFERKP